MCERLSYSLSLVAVVVVVVDIPAHTHTHTVALANFSSSKSAQRLREHGSGSVSHFYACVRVAARAAQKIKRAFVRAPCVRVLCCVYHIFQPLPLRRVRCARREFVRTEKFLIRLLFVMCVCARRACGGVIAQIAPLFGRHLGGTRYVVYRYEVLRARCSRSSRGTRSAMMSD